MKTLICIVIILLSGVVFAQSEPTTHYEVFVVKFAELKNKILITDIAIGSKDNDSVNVCYMIWLLKSNSGKYILVDAGFADTSGLGSNMYFTRPDSVLNRLGLSTSDISDIVLTHPHWDHIGGIDLFPDARVWMQREDYNYFVGQAWQEAGNKMGFTKPDVAKIVSRNLDDRLILVHGDSLEILPGITVYTGSKHTHETQYVSVRTTSDPVIIASDNSWFSYNLKQELPIPVTHDTQAYVQNLKRMKTMTKNIDLILPGHDPSVMTKFPRVADDIVKVR